MKKADYNDRRLQELSKVLGFITRDVRSLYSIQTVTRLDLLPVAQALLAAGLDNFIEMRDTEQVIEKALA